MSDYRHLVVLPALLLALHAGGAPAAAQAQAHGAIAIAARDLPRGLTLSAEDIRLASPGEDTGAGRPFAGAAATPEVEVGPGWVTRRVIAEGEPLRVPAVGPPEFVRGGEEVVVVSRTGAVEIRLRGKAMGSAAEGDRVMVRIDSRRRVEGTATAPGIVHIQGAQR